MSARHEWNAVAVVWRSAWQGYRHVSNPWWMLGLLTPMLLLIVLLMAWQVDGFAATALLMACLTVVGAGVWGGLCVNVLQQNLPQLARLVPGQARVLRRSLWLSAALVVAVTTGLFALQTLIYTDRLQPAIWVFGVVAMAMAGFLALIALVLRWPWLLLAAIALPLIGVALAQTHASASANAQGGPLAWVAATTLTLALIAASMRWTVMSGGPRHAAIHRRAPRMTTPSDRGDPLAATLGHSHPRLLDVLTGHSLFRALLRWPWPGRSNPTHRLALGLPPNLHPLGLLAARWPSAVLLLALLLVFELLPNGELRHMLRLLLLIWVVISYGLVLGSFERIEFALRSIGGEPALLRLLPGAPQGRHLNRWLARWLAVDVAVLLGWSGLLLAFGLTWLGEADSPLALGALFLWLCSLALLPCLWRDWSRVPPARQQATSMVRWFLLMFGVMGVALAVVLLVPQQLPWLAALMLLAGAVWGWWRWRKLSHAPVAFPLGHALGRGQTNPSWAHTVPTTDTPATQAAGPGSPAP